MQSPLYSHWRQKTGESDRSGLHCFFFFSFLGSAVTGLKNLTPLTQPMKCKTDTSHHAVLTFSRVFILAMYIIVMNSQSGFKAFVDYTIVKESKKSTSKSMLYFVEFLISKTLLKVNIIASLLAFLLRTHQWTKGRHQVAHKTQFHSSLSGLHRCVHHGYRWLV